MAFKEAWEEALRQLVERETAAHARRLVARVSRANLCSDAMALCALASTRGDVDEAVSRLARDRFRSDMALAAELHGLASLDATLRKVYVPGTSGSDQSIVRDLPSMYRKCTHKVRVR